MRISESGSEARINWVGFQAIQPRMLTSMTMTLGFNSRAFSTAFLAVYRFAAHFIVWLALK